MNRPYTYFIEDITMADGLSIGIYRIDGTQQGRAALTILNGLRVYYATTPVMEDERVPLTILIDSKCHSHTAHVSTGDAKHHTSDRTTSLSTYYIMYVYEYIYIYIHIYSVYEKLFKTSDIMYSFKGIYVGHSSTFSGHFACHKP